MTNEGRTSLRRAHARVSHTGSLWLAVGLLLVLFCQLATSSTVKSPVFDEPLHTARAYYVHTTGTWDMQAGHTPLLYRMLAPVLSALPDLPKRYEVTSSHDHVQMARDIIRALDRPWDVLILPLRVVVMGLTLLLGSILYRWASERHGAHGGLLALFVYVFSPNILAHGRLVTTDLLLTCFFFLAVYTFQRLLRCPTPGRSAIAGVSLGLALASKVSALLLLPLFLLVLTWMSVGPNSYSCPASTTPSQWWHRFLSYMGWFCCTGLIAGAVVWSLYGLEIGPWAEGWPALPLRTYLRTVLHVGEHGGIRGHPAFLMGKRSGGGWWTYFPIALAIKTPLPTLIGAMLGTSCLLVKKRWWLCLTGLLPPALFLTAATYSSLNIGYRHILPLVPFLILLLSAAADLQWHRPPLALIAAGMALWLIVGTLRIYPDYLAYFNALVGGPSGGRHYLTDSNLDWGQDLKQLRDYLEKRDIESVHLSYFGNVQPEAYDIAYEPLPSHFSIGEVRAFTPFAPRPGNYAVSVTNLSGQFLIDNPTVLDWFNHHDPVASIGHSINIYEVGSDPSPPKWVGMCQAPGAPLDAEAFARQVGREDLRFVYFDCRNSWIFTAEGQPAWHVVPATEETEDLTPPAGSWITTYEQENYDGKRLFTLYRWSITGGLQAHLDGLRSTSGLPARLGDVLSLLGYELETVPSVDHQPTLQLRSYWRVLGQPSQPLSLMAHLMDQEGETVAIGDGLGIPIESWAPGDIIVQTHRFPVKAPSLLEETHLQVGAYWLTDLERLPVFDHRGDRLPQDAVSLVTSGARATR